MLILHSLDVIGWEGGGLLVLEANGSITLEIYSTLYQLVVNKLRVFKAYSALLLGAICSG